MKHPGVRWRPDEHGCRLLALSVVVLAGCGPTVVAGRPTTTPRGALVLSEARAARCPRSPGGAGRTFRADLPGPVTDPELVGYLDALPAQARRTAVAAGLEPIVAEILRERVRSGGAPTLELLALRQELDEGFASLQPQLLAMEFEAECVIALMSETLEEHDDRVGAYTTALTVASLVVGAVSGLGAGIWDLTGTESSGPTVVGIAGAAATTALGAAALAPSRRRIVFVHEHNLLAPIVRGEDPGHLYPTFVFRILDSPREPGAPSPRQELLAAWQALIDDAVDEDERARAEAILWGDGGVYDADLLLLRRRLFEELEATFDSFARDIDFLTQALALVLRPAGS
jgi:hypothetical protein